MSHPLNQLRKKISEFISSVILQDSEEPLSSGTLAHINERLGLHSLSEYLPYETFDPTTTIFHCKEAKGIVIEAIPMVGASDNDADTFYALLQRILPEGTILHCLLYASPHLETAFDAFVSERNNQHPLMMKLAKERVAFYKKGAYETLIQNQQAILRDYKILLCLNFDNKMDLNEAKVVTLKNNLMGALKAVGMNAKSLDAAAFMSWINTLLRPSDALSEKPFAYNELNTLAAQLAAPECSKIITPSKIFLYEGEQQKKWQIRNYRISNFRDEAPHLSEMSDLIGNLFDNTAQIGCPFSLSFVIQILDQNKEQTVARARAFRARQRAEKIARFSPKSVEEAHTARDIIKSIEDEERLVLVSFQATLYCHTKTADQNESALMNVFQASSCKWQVVKNHLLHMVMLLAHLPLSQSHALLQDLNQLGVMYKLWAKNAANMLPVVAEMKGMDSHRLMLAGRRGQILFWDPFGNNRGNYNVCVAGISGSGKSVTVQEIVSGLVGTGGRVFIIDVGRSYKKLCHLLGGEFIEFNKETALCLNPFTHVSEVDEFLSFMTPFVCFMINPSGDPASIEVSFIAKAVKSVWDEKGTKGSVSDIADWLSEQSDKRAQDLAIILYPFTKDGQYGSYFNGEANIDFNNEIVVFELEEINNNKRFQGIIFMLLMHHVAEKMYLGGRKKQTALIIDEAWDMLKGGQGGHIIENIARRARKYKGCLVTITQSIADYFASPAAEAAYTNSYWKLIHMQNKSDITRLVENQKLILNNFQKKLLASVTTEHGAYSEMMIMGDGGEYTVGRLLLDPYSRVLYSTQAKDYEAINELCNQGVLLEEAIRIVSIERFPQKRETK